MGLLLLEVRPALRPNVEDCSCVEAAAGLAWENGPFQVILCDTPLGLSLLVKLQTVFQHSHKTG